MTALMTYIQRAISSLNTIAAVAVSVVFLLLPPASYGIVAYIDLVGQMEREVDLAGQVIGRAIVTAPRLWTFQEVRFTELLSRQPATLEKALLAIFDSKDALVASVGKPPAWPVVVREVSLYDSGVVVGRLEIAHSLREILLTAA